MDFITDLPAYGSQSIIMVVINRFSKAAQFGTLPAKFLHTGEHFTSIICILHGDLGASSQIVTRFL